MHWSRVITLALKEFMADNGTRLAAALAYYGVFSLAPLLLVGVGIASILLGDGEINAFTERLKAFLGPRLTPIVMAMLASNEGQVGGALPVVVGVGVLLYSASLLFFHLADSFNTILGVPPAHETSVASSLRPRFWTFLVMLGAAALLVGSFGVSGFVGRLGAAYGVAHWVLETAHHVILSVLLAGATAMLYVHLPAARIAYRQALPGAVLSTLLMLVTRFGFVFYVRLAGDRSPLLAAGSPTLLLLWCYLIAQFILYGMEVTKVIARELRPSAPAT